MGVTSSTLLELGIVDHVIPEPLGGAHRSVAEMATRLRETLAQQLDVLLQKTTDVLLEQRYQRLMSFGNP
jgi:acetyl-CoA carboxylase carboxyl transferase subunit alpha